MTIIAAASWDGETWIGCDRAGTDGWGTQTDFGIKLHEFDWGTVGYTGSYRTIQVIHRDLRKVDDFEGDAGIERVVEIIGKSLEDAGWSKSASGELPTCKGLHLLIATKAGEIYQVHDDLSWFRHEAFAAVGSGFHVALGSLHTSHARWMETAQGNALGGVQDALKSACDIIASCAFPAEPIRVS